MLQLSQRELTQLFRVHQGRRRGHPMVGQRAAGHRYESAGCPIVSSTGYAELQAGDLTCSWYRHYGPRPSGNRPGCYSAHVRTCGAFLSFDAVVDDFGNLVQVEPLQ